MKSARDLMLSWTLDSLELVPHNPQPVKAFLNYICHFWKDKQGVNRHDDLLTCSSGSLVVV